MSWLPAFCPKCGAELVCTTSGCHCPHCDYDSNKVDWESIRYTM